MRWWPVLLLAAAAAAQASTPEPPAPVCRVERLTVAHGFGTVEKRSCLVPLLDRLLN
jgi:hypothetical protein